MKKMPARVLADALEQIIDRKFAYEEKDEKPRDWSAYNKARVRDLSHTLKMIREYVDAVPVESLPEKKGPGKNPEYTAHEKAKAVLLTEAMLADERTGEDLVNLFKEKLGISESMSARTIGRAYYDDRVIFILEQIFKKTNKPIQGKEHSFSGDSSGLKKTNKVNYANDKEDEKKKKDFAMLSYMVSNTFNVYTSFDLHYSGSINDAPTLKPLVNQTRELHPKVNAMQFDAGFLSRENVQYLADNDIEPFIFPKRNVTLKPKGCPAWRNMIWDCVTDTQNWLRGYHERSNSETNNSIHEYRFPKPLNCKQAKGQYTETISRLDIINFRQLHLAKYTHKLKIYPKQWLNQN